MSDVAPGRLATLPEAPTRCVADAQAALDRAQATLKSCDARVAEITRLHGQRSALQEQLERASSAAVRATQRVSHTEGAISTWTLLSK